MSWLRRLSGQRLSLFAAVLGAASFFAYSVLRILTQSPYPMNPDEAFIMDHAWDIAISGDLNPHFFNYGSLPIYLTAAALRVAAWFAQLRGQIGQLSEIESICFPFYEMQGVSNTPRVLFALFGSLALLAAAGLGHALRARPEALLVPLCVLAFTPLFQAQALTYVNVDIVVTLLVLAALVHLVLYLERDSFTARALIPACFCGAALATKYNAGLLLLPFACASMRPPWRRSLAQLFVLGTATGAVFLLLQPFAALSFSEFWHDVHAEMEHYRAGHPGHDAAPGLPQLKFYVKQLRKELGLMVCALIGLGVVDALRTQRRRALLVLAFPLASFAFMIQQRVHFTRNLLPAIAVLSAFTGLGLASLSDALVSVVARFRHVPEWLVRSALVLALLSCASALPRLRPRGSFKIAKPDSRSLLASWLREHAQQGACTVVLPRELGVKPDTIAPHCALRTFDVNESSGPEQVVSELASLRGTDETYIALAQFAPIRGGDPTQADAWNTLEQQLQLAQPLLKLGKTDVRLNRRNLANPKIRLYRLGAP